MVRTAEDTIKAFHNSCRHRGTTLAEGSGKAGVLRCPFHAWSWNLDGTIRAIPAEWDFGYIEHADLSLAEAAVVFLALYPPAVKRTAL